MTFIADISRLNDHLLISKVTFSIRYELNITTVSDAKKFEVAIRNTPLKLNQHV